MAYVEQLITYIEEQVEYLSLVKGSQQPDEYEKVQRRIADDVIAKIASEGGMEAKHGTAIVKL
eukprot:7356475-Karenia_brevis.AAC.1